MKPTNGTNLPNIQTVRTATNETCHQKDNQKPTNRTNMPHIRTERTETSETHQQKNITKTYERNQRTEPTGDVSLTTITISI